MHHLHLLFYSQIICCHKGFLQLFTASFHFHCHRSTLEEPKTTNSSVRALPPPSTNDRANKAAKQKTREAGEGKKVSHASGCFSSIHALFCKNICFRFFNSNKMEKWETKVKWDKNITGKCVGIVLTPNTSWWNVIICLSISSTESILKASLYVNTHILHRRKLRHRTSLCISVGDQGKELKSSDFQRSTGRSCFLLCSTVVKDLIYCSSEKEGNLVPYTHCVLHLHFEGKEALLVIS